MIKYFRSIALQSPWIQLLFFVIITIGSLILFSLLGQLLAIAVYGFSGYQQALVFLGSPDLITSDTEVKPASLVGVLAITQIMSQAGLFILPPLLFMILVFGGRKWVPLLSLDRAPYLYTVLMVLALVIMVLPLVAWLTEVNMAIPLPAALQRAEDQAEAIIALFFNDPGIGRFILNMFMVAVIPAIGEELLFRGVIQRYLIAGLKNMHVAVFLTAVIFSFFHFQFHGFFPRMLLGLLFGYLLVWTGSLWIPIIAHFINNGAAVVVEFLSQRKVIASGYQDFGHDTGTIAVTFSIIATLSICFFIWFFERKLERPEHN